MAIGPRLEQRQGQSLVMTPQLQQAIKLLQMSNIEVQEFVEAELERNPLLERDDRGNLAERTEAPAEAGPADMVGELASGRVPEETPAAAESGLERSPAPGAADSGWASLRPSSGAAISGEDLEFGANLSKPASLADHLSEQLSLALHDPVDRLIGQHLIGMVNDSGYLSGELSGIAETLGAGTADIARVLAVLQGFDPPGVMARDLKECLAIQLREQGRFDPAMARLLDNLPLVARRDYKALKAICGVDADDLDDMLRELRKLNPKPGNAFGSEPVQPVIPDVTVKAAPDGTWIVELNSDTLPRVLVNNQYLARVSAGAVSTEDKLYLSECQANASWLIRSLDQRAKTILKVAREIVRQQDAFLVHGVRQLRPITLRTVAEAIEMHESTISRVTSNKFMATPRGVFELKYFFTTAIASADSDGDQHSAEAVRHHIKDLIGGEGEVVLSDDEIVARLRQMGIELARRTVAKYRESLGIPSSVQRRREIRGNRPLAR